MGNTFRSSKDKEKSKKATDKGAGSSGNFNMFYCICYPLLIHILMFRNIARGSRRKRLFRF